ncbi:MAG: hypothetical protein ACXWVI_05965 [Methyloceanibacter sp.]
MYGALLRRSLLALVAAAAGFGGKAAIPQGFDPNIVSRVDSFIPTSPETVLPTRTERVPVKRTEQYSVVVEEKKTLSLAEREAKAKAMGVVVPLGLRSTTARKAYLNMRRVPTQVVTKVRKQRSRTVTEIVEKKQPRKTEARGIASASYTFATNANQADLDIIADSIGGQNANLLVLVPAGREEDTVSFLLGPTAVRYATLDSSSFDALNGSISYTRLLGRRQTASGYTTGGTATTDLLTLGVDGTSVYEPGFGSSEIVIATPSIGWSRSNIGLGNKMCGAKGSEAYCTYANVSLSLGESWADVQSQINSWAVAETTLGWRPPVKGLSLSATGSLQGVVFSDYPGGRQDFVFVGSGNLSWAPAANVSLSAGVKFTQQLSTQSDLDWNGFTVLPQALLNVKFY